jgi:hypothetical protein
LFLDESVITSRVAEQRVWARAGLMNPGLPKEKIMFPAVALTAAMDVKGRVVA